MNRDEIRNYINIVEYSSKLDNKVDDDDSQPSHWVDKLISQMEVNPLFSIDYVSAKLAEMTKK